MQRRPFIKAKRFTKRHVPHVKSFPAKRFVKRTFKARAVTVSRFRAPMPPCPVQPLLSQLQSLHYPLGLAPVDVFDPTGELSKKRHRLQAIARMNTFDIDDAPEGKEEKKEERPTIPFLTGMLRGMISAEKVYPFTLGSVVTVSSSGTGTINATVAVSNVYLVPEFSAFAALFSEVFVLKVTHRWEPQNRYTLADGQLATPTLTTSSGTGIAVTSLYNGAPAYTSATNMMNNSSTLVHNDRDPFSHTWHNNTRWKSGISLQFAGEPQSWANTNSTAGIPYSGMVQLFSTAITTLTPNTLMGTLMIRYHVLFRARQ
jgi:hypothetical protein